MAVPSRGAGSFKADEHRFLELTGLPGFAPAPYLAPVKWLQLIEPRALPRADLKDLLQRSHALVLGSLSKKFQKQTARLMARAR